ncbi:hypothetical protein QYM36_011548 [Artemia franciscana]|uniref:glutathione transferase n=1 Tax=Artemia franciscana TaxID=6661 RepID=A0AA88HKG7_ARTSF|nr:hypothetical protein QYM36_011548 [Artemia franciscana]
MPKTYKLTYFNLRAKGEPIRLILAYGNIQYEDNRIEFSDWPALKPKTPFGQLPVLEVDGKPLAQSNAIARFLAKQCNLMPATDWEQAQADELADLANDIFTMTRPVNLVLVRDDAKRQSAIPEVLASLAPLLDKVEARLLANSHGWLVGNKENIIGFRRCFFVILHQHQPDAHERTGLTKALFRPLPYHYA